MTEKYMKLAIELALKGTGHVSPNPLVGAVIVKNGKIIGEGYHARYGDLHAERASLKSCTEDPRGADMYVTLEPCCHHGKQPPCTEAIIENGISHVIIGSKDPNPLVAGKGTEILRKAGIKVTEGFLKEECDSINYVFFHYIRTGLPYIVMKYAMTTDGKTATYTGESKWITGEAARHRVHEDRHRYKAIMTGVNTVLTDDPLLTCRIENGRNPIRIICDTRLRTPIDSNIVNTASEIPTIIATGVSDEDKKVQMLKNKGCEILHLPKINEHIDLKTLMKKLGEMKIDSIFLESGGRLSWSLLEAGLVNRVQTYIAPKLFGGKTSPTPLQGTGVKTPDECFTLSKPQITVIGNDILLESEVTSCLQE